MADEDADKVVHITLDSNGMPIPDQDPVFVKKDKQKIKWCADFHFTIAINGYSDVKHGNGGGDCAHSAKTGVFRDAVGKKYKYSITANGKINDPDVEIQP